MTYPEFEKSAFDLAQDRMSIACAKLLAILILATLLFLFIGRLIDKEKATRKHLHHSQQCFKKLSVEMERQINEERRQHLIETAELIERIQNLEGRLNKAEEKAEFIARCADRMKEGKNV